MISRLERALVGDLLRFGGDEAREVVHTHCGGANVDHCLVANKLFELVLIRYNWHRISVTSGETPISDCHMLGRPVAHECFLGLPPVDTCA